jgi:Arc/MetJ-type ribon-helix-helix transcriptional regulator
MRTIVELPGEQIEALDALCRRDRISRAEAVRRAVALLVRTEGGMASGVAFGIWRDRREDGLAYQRRVRCEWHEAAAPRKR